MGSTSNLTDVNVKKSLEEIEGCQKYIMAPDNSFHKYWDPIIVLLLLYTAFFVPYKIAFL